MLQKIMSGGQTGADIAGLDAAIANGIPYGGWLTKDRRTEDGPLDDKYQLLEMETRGDPKRTERNVKKSDGTVIFVQGKLTGGSALTRKYAVKHKKPWLHINLKLLTVQKAVIRLEAWVEKEEISVLNVAGRCASKDPEIYDITFTVLNEYLEKIRRN